MYVMQVSEVGFQINIYYYYLLFHDFSHFRLTSFLPIYVDWPRLSASEGHCREKTEVHSQGKSNKWCLGHSSELLTLWMLIWAGPIKPLHKDVWLSGPGSTLPSITTTHNQWHNLYLSFSVVHNSLAASKKNLTWTSLSKRGMFWPM